MSKPKTRKLKISRVWIEHKVDEHPDLSWLGFYSNTLNEMCNEFTVDRFDNLHADRNSMRYFTATNNQDIDQWDHVSDVDVRHAYLRDVPTGPQQCSRLEMCEALNAHYRLKDYERMEAYNAGQWHMIGIIAKAEIFAHAGIIQTLRSGGLWSIESDSGAEYLKSVEDEQLQELRAELLALGIGERAIQHAFRNVERAGQ